MDLQLFSIIRPLFDDIHFYYRYDICDPLSISIPPDRSQIFFFGILVSIFRGVEMDFQKNAYLFLFWAFLLSWGLGTTSPGWHCNQSLHGYTDKVP